MQCKRSKCENVVNYYGTLDLCPKHLKAHYQELERLGIRRRGYGDIEAVRDHVQTLRKSGMGNRRIAELAEVSVFAVQNLDKRQRIYAGTADRILSVHPNAADKALVDATGSRRRLQGLVAMGHTQAWMAKKLGTYETAVYKIISCRSMVTADMARRIKALHAKWEATPGPSDRSRRRAARQGWPAPFAWDPETIDNPSAEPDSGADPVFLEQVDDMRTLGKPDAEIADFFGITKASLWDKISRHKKRAA